MRLLIAIPCADTVRWEFAESLARLEIQLAEDGIDFDVKFLAGSLIYAARDDLAFYATGIYRSRRSPYAYALFSDNERGQRVLKLEAEPFEIQSCGFGCVLMETEVIRQVRRKNGCCFLPTVGAGEDIAFCDRYIQTGGKIYAVPDAKCNHITYIPLRCDDATRLIEYKEQR